MVVCMHKYVPRLKDYVFVSAGEECDFVAGLVVFTQQLDSLFLRGTKTFVPYCCTLSRYYDLMSDYLAVLAGDDNKHIVRFDVHDKGWKGHE